MLTRRFEVYDQVVFTIECTKKVLDRLGRLPSGDASSPSTRLGDWCATLIEVRNRELFLVVSMRSLLPVLIPVVPAGALAGAMREAIGGVLGRLGVPDASIEAELREMDETRLARTSSRRVLGSMTDFGFMANAYRDVRDLTEVALRLADAPCRPIDMRSPGAVAKELLEAGE